MAHQKHVNISIDSGQTALRGDLVIPDNAIGIVLFAHGSGSSRLSPRNMFVAGELQALGIGTLLFDLLTEYEDLEYERRFDIELLTERLVQVVRWVQDRPDLVELPIGLFGASTGAAAALKAAARLKSEIRAVVSRGGRPDLAGEELANVEAPTLLIVGSLDETVLELNQQAFSLLPSDTVKELAIVPGATHLFEESGTLEQAAQLASNWFKNRLTIG